MRRSENLNIYIIFVGTNFKNSKSFFYKLNFYIFIGMVFLHKYQGGGGVLLEKALVHPYIIAFHSFLVRGS